MDEWAATPIERQGAGSSYQSELEIMATLVD